LGAGGVATTGRATTRVVVVDDDDDVRESVAWRLDQAGCAVFSAADGTEAIGLIDSTYPDVVVIDLVLPGRSGLDVLRAARALDSDPIIIVVSGRSDETDRIVAFEMGADDFVVKPFSPRELVARVNSFQRRRLANTTDSATDSTIRFDGLLIDLERREALVRGRAVRLTVREFELLVFLARSPGRVYSRDELLREVWDSTSEWQDGATVTEHVRRLRLKLEDDPRNPRWILNVRGHGYVFEA
jgi:DNA-binding response OmpR family regulator